MAEKYVRQKLGLNDFYMQYVRYRSFNLRMAEAYAGLYRMYGGKKEVMEVTPATYWFLGVQERMHLVSEEIRNKELKFEKEYKDIRYYKLPSELKEEEQKVLENFNREIIEYMYNKMFMPSLFALKNYFNIEYKIIKKTTTGVSYEIYKTDGTLLLADKFNFTYGYLHSDVNKKMNMIYTYLNNNVSLNDAEHIMNGIHHEIFITDKRIINWFYPNPRKKYNVN